MYDENRNIDKTLTVPPVNLDDEIGLCYFAQIKDLYMKWI